MSGQLVSDPVASPPNVRRFQGRPDQRRVRDGTPAQAMRLLHVPQAVEQTVSFVSFGEIGPDQQADGVIGKRAREIGAAIFERRVQCLGHIEPFVAGHEPCSIPGPRRPARDAGATERMTVSEIVNVDDNARITLIEKGPKGPGRIGIGFQTLASRSGQTLARLRIELPREPGRGPFDGPQVAADRLESVARRSDGSRRVHRDLGHRVVLQDVEKLVRCGALQNSRVSARQPHVEVVAQHDEVSVGHGRPISPS